MKIYFFSLVFLISSTLVGQIKYAPATLHEEEIMNKLNEIKSGFNQVHCPGQYSTAFFAALPYFPDLLKCRIKLVEKKHSSMMMHARPSFFSVFRRPNHRKYKIFINTNGNDRIPDLNNFTYNAQIGIFAHELAHLSDYEKSGFFKLIKLGLQELGNADRKKFEQRIDAEVLTKGLGWQLYDYCVQWNNLSEYYSNYLKTKRAYYLSPEVMLGLLLSHGYQ